MNASELSSVVARALVRAGSDTLFGLPGGGNNLELIGAAEAAGMRFVLTHTENAAAIMAATYAELQRCPTACVVTRGPGAASTVNGVAQAGLDRQPLVLITDTVSSADARRVSHQRLDQRAMFGDLVKWSAVLGQAQPGETMASAMAVAAQPRPGPVHLDFDPSSGEPPPDPPSSPPTSREQMDEALEVLSRSRRPVLLLGQGALATVGEIRKLVEGTQVPVLMTYKAKGIIPDSWPNSAGLLTGAAAEAATLESADVIVALGVDAVELIPNPWPYQAPVLAFAEWPEQSPYFHPQCEVIDHLATSISAVARHLSEDWPPAAGRCARLEGIRRLVADESPTHGVSPQSVVRESRRIAPSGTVATIDSGAHMLVAMPLWEVEQPGEALISSGLATMGFALPAAIAASLARPTRHVLCLVGDGGLGIGLAELETVVRLRLPITVVVFNDSTLSLIAIKQKKDGHGGAGAVRYAATDFARIADGFGMESFRVSDEEALARELRSAINRPSPTLLDVRVDPSGYPDILRTIRGSGAR